MPSSLGRLISVTIVASSMLLLLSSSANAQPVFKIDHFKCYITTGSPVGREVLLQDQFDRRIGTDYREVVRVWRPFRFCNPVEKTRADTGQVTPITNPESHLKLYRIFPDDQDFAPTRRVLIENQFGRKTIRTFDPGVLAVPTSKDTHPPHHDLDHFKCYRAYGGNINRLVHLKDQFTSETNTKVLDPLIFCNPTEKIHDGATTPITNEEDHLACYRITRRPFQREVLARNQFGDERLFLRDSDVLCVPSKKLRVRE